jgi:hypothetical protein
MSDDALWLDGNALAGPLGELLGFEITQAPRGCQSCRAVHPIGAHRLYLGAGAVLRCPACGDVALRLVTRPDGHLLQLTGVWTLELARVGAPPHEPRKEPYD